MCKEVEANVFVGLGDAAFTINYTVGPIRKTETGHFPSCFAAL